MSDLCPKDILYILLILMFNLISQWMCSVVFALTNPLEISKLTFSGLILRRSQISLCPSLSFGGLQYWSFSGLNLWRSPIRPCPDLSFATFSIQTCQTYVPTDILYVLLVLMLNLISQWMCSLVFARTYPLQVSNLSLPELILWRSPYWPFSRLILWRTPICLFPDLSFADLQFVLFRTYPLQLIRYRHVRTMLIWTW